MRPPYRIYFRQRNVGIVGCDDFEAENDRTALSIGESMCDACADVCDHFELWQGTRLVGGCSNGNRMKLDAPQLNAKTQAAAAECEERLLDSTWAIARSRRLLQRVRHQINP